MNEILDSPLTEKPIYNKYRPLPLLLEFFPLFVGLIGILFKTEEMITLGLLAATMVYTFLSWYLFKALKYSIWDILVAIFFGLGMAVVLLGVLFYCQDWEGMKEMVFAGYMTLLVCLPIALLYAAIRFFVVKDRQYEFTMSWKILSRFLVLFIIHHLFGLHSFFYNIF